MLLSLLLPDFEITSAHIATEHGVVKDRLSIRPVSFAFLRFSTSQLSFILQKSGAVTTNSLRMQERIRLVLQVDSVGLSPRVDSARLSFSDEVPSMLTRSQRSASSSSLFKESAVTPDENGSLLKESFEEEQDIAAELEAAKSLLEMYKQRSGDLVHLIEDVRNQLMALQIENATLKIENEELKKSNEVLIKANQAQPKANDNSSLAGQAEQNPTDD